MASFC